MPVNHEVAAGSARPVLPDNLAGIVEKWRLLSPSATALIAPGHSALDYGGLHRQIQRIAGALSFAGVGRHDRVAVVLPNGPDLAVAVLATACCATCAPINPALRENELRACLDDLQPRALVLSEADEGVARRVAEALGIRCLDLRHDASAPAGAFEMAAGGPVAPETSSTPAGDDVALVVQTSGTTSRPKYVPLSHRALVHSAANLAAWLALRTDDRCLNLMPLFHTHGLVAAVLASLAAGSSAACAPGMQNGRFAALIDELQPTWYTAVPTIHQAVYEELAGATSKPIASRLRFVRSTSASLSPRLAAGLEDVLGVPVIEAYAMTEAAGQIASNPLPPALRKPGSVGTPAGAEIAIVGADGRALGRGESGEIAIRGETVISSYVADPDANDAAFIGEWLRTGDLGRIDPDGYLTITGRLKEVVNRGGEKILPREIDEALLAHPAVRQAVAFAVPHRTLGEDVVAAVVLRPGASVSKHALRLFLLDRLADSKVPSDLLMTDCIPTDAVGKVQRAELAAQHREQLASSEVGPTGEMEATVAAHFSDVLGVGQVGADDNFFALGGDSLRGAQVLARIQETVGVELQPLILFRSPTVAEFAREIESARTGPRKGSLAGILEHVDALSDEEARAWATRKTPGRKRP